MVNLALSDLVDAFKQGIIDLEDPISTPQIHLSNTVTGETVEFSMLPEAIHVKTTSSFRSFNIIQRGEVKFPKGEQLAQISWQGYLPSARLLMYNFLQHELYEQPLEIIRALNRWREQGDKLQLLISQTAINLPVYLKSLDTDYKKSLAVISYSIQFLAAKQLTILTVEEADAQNKNAAQARNVEVRRRAAMKSRAGILFGDANSLWEVAKILTGSGGNWQAIMERNNKTDPTSFEPTDWVMNL